VAIVLTGLFISVFGQVFAIARGSNRIPGELFAAVARGRTALSEASHFGPGKTIDSGGLFRERVEISRPNIIENPGRIPPPIRAAPATRQPAPNARQLRAVDVVITTPSGRHTELESVSSVPLQK
jgi:hypothetical protein